MRLWLGSQDIEMALKAAPAQGGVCVCLLPPSVCLFPLLSRDPALESFGFYQGGNGWILRQLCFKF